MANTVIKAEMRTKAGKGSSRGLGDVYKRQVQYVGTA